MTGLPLIIAFVVAIVLMIVMISKLRIHPFISIMLVSLGLGLVAGIPLVDHKLEGGAVQHVHEHRHRHHPRCDDRDGT